MKNLLAILLLALVITSCNKENEDKEELLDDITAILDVDTNLSTVTVNKDSTDEEMFENMDSIIILPDYSTKWLTLNIYPEYNKVIALNLSTINSEEDISIGNLSTQVAITIQRDRDGDSFGKYWGSDSIISWDTDISIDSATNNLTFTYIDLEFKGTSSDSTTVKTFNINIVN